MEKLLLVDGSNLLFQMFYGMPNASPAANGQDIRGTIGFLGALRRMLEMTCPTHVAVLFDGECENSRTELDENYKANRPDYDGIPEEETPFGQLGYIYKALDRLGIRHKETENCETDDWIAAYALALGERMEVVIASFDSDYFQLLTEQVSVLRYRGDRSAVWTPATLEEKLGITPGMYAQFKALTGDAADNIAGVPKVGPKTAAALLKQFGSLEAMIEGWEAIRKPSVRDAIREHSNRLRRNLALIRLEGVAELPFAPESLAYQPTGFSTNGLLTEMGLLEKRL